jgi:hypothetical protein
MVTNYPHRIASREGAAGVETHRADDGIGTALMAKVRQLFCGIHGHDDLLQFEQDRMFLRCVSCGHESPGWEITEATSGKDVPVAQGEARRPAMVRPQLVDARRIA